MKTAVLLTFVCSLLATPCFVLGRAVNDGSKRIDSGNARSISEEGAPDLLVKEIVFEQAPSKIRVRIQNQGKGPSSSCYLALQSLVANSPALATTQRVWTIQIPALAGGKGYSNLIDVSPLKQVNGPWRAIVDRSDEVKESDEGNNVMTYPVQVPGPSSPRRRNYLRRLFH